VSHISGAIASTRLTFFVDVCCLCAVLVEMSLKRASPCVSDVPRIKKICSDSLLEVEQSSSENAVTSSRIDDAVEGSK